MQIESGGSLTKHKIDMRNSPRRAHFEYFLRMANPFVGVTVNVDATELVAACRREGRSFYAAMIHAAAVQRAEINEDGDPDSMLFITCLPWIHYTALVQPTGDDSNPRISWGKYECDARGRQMLPVTLLAHHGLVDGVNLGQFYAELQKEL